MAKMKIENFDGKDFEF